MEVRLRAIKDIFASDAWARHTSWEFVAQLAKIRHLADLRAVATGNPNLITILRALVMTVTVTTKSSTGTVPAPTTPTTELTAEEIEHLVTTIRTFALACLRRMAEARNEQIGALRGEKEARISWENALDELDSNGDERMAAEFFFEHLEWYSENVFFRLVRVDGSLSVTLSVNRDAAAQSSLNAYCLTAPRRIEILDCREYLKSPPGRILSLR